METVWDPILHPVIRAAGVCNFFKYQMRMRTKFALDALDGSLVHGYLCIGSMYIADDHSAHKMPMYFRMPFYNSEMIQNFET